MANSMNKAMIIGYVGRDPEMRYTANGQGLLKFSVATSKSYKDKSGQWNDETTWHNITVWGKMAESLSQKLAKGSRVYIEGSIKNGSYEKDGRKMYTSEINPYQVIDLSPKAKDGFSGDGDGGGDDSQQELPNAGVGSDDVPF